MWDLDTIRAMNARHARRGARPTMKERLWAVVDECQSLALDNRRDRALLVHRLAEMLGDE